MRGRRTQLQGFRGGFGLCALGISKEFNEGRGTIGLSAKNFVGRGWTLRSELQTATFSQVREDVLLNRNVKLTFGYKFGQLDANKARSKTRGVSNDDMGGGDDGSGGAGAGGGAQVQGQSRRQARQAVSEEVKAKKAKKKEKATAEEEPEKK